MSGIWALLGIAFVIWLIVEQARPACGSASKIGEDVELPP